MKNKKKFFSILFIVIFSVSYLFVVKYLFDLYNTKKQSRLLNEISIETQEMSQNETGNISNINTEQLNTLNETNEKTERMLKVEELKKINSDIIGWLEIENTDINFPVLQGEDNSYYMKHNYKKKYSKNGAIFLDKDYKWDPPSSNLLIYGHNMKNNTMFQSLLKYKNKSYYNKHPIIKFTTDSYDKNFEIISVFESRVYYKSEQNVFRYYYFINANNEAEYNEFVNNCKKSSLYDTKVTAKYNEQLLTLSTCSYHTKDGRFVVVAKEQQ